MEWFIKLVKKKSKEQNLRLGQLLRTARQEMGITQTLAAAWVGRDQTFIVRIEKGTQQATFVEVEQLAKAYGKQLSDFKTIDQVETKYRHFALKSDAVADYRKFLLEQRKERRKRKSRKPKPRARMGKRS
jgi:predicted transcriptional regulator